MSRESLRSLLGRAWNLRAPEWRRFAMSLSRNPADADDLVDEAVLRTLRADPRLGSETEVNAYIVASIRNTWFNWRRRRGRRQKFLNAARFHLPRESSSSLHSFLRVEEQGRLEEAVAAALAKMQPKIRQAVELYLLEDPPLILQQLAEIQGVAVSTAHARVQEGLELLGSELREFNK